MRDAASASPGPAGLSSRLDLLHESVASLSESVSGQVEQILTGLQYLIDDDPAGRRQLAELRDSVVYEEAFITPNPLVSVLIPTFDRTEPLTTRAIPSVLAQTHDNVEVVVIGDGSPGHLVEAVATIEDPRLRFHNLTYNGPYEQDRYSRWCASGTPALNAALRHARGHWISVLGDDDQMPASHIEILLDFARRSHVEFVYGRLRITDREGVPHVTGSFPPAFGQINLQSSLWHAGLRFLEFELAQAALGVPNDWALVRRMMRVGVTMAHTESTTVDWTPSSRARATEQRVDSDQPRRLRRRIAQLEDQVSALQHERDALSERLVERLRQGREAESRLQQQIDEMQASPGWRVTAALRMGRDVIRRGR